MPRTILSLFLAGAAMPIAAQQTGSVQDLARKFGARERVQQISLSPDGTKAAIVTPTAGSGSAVVVADLKDGSTKPILKASGTTDQLSGCRWATASRLICNLYFIATFEATRLGATRAYTLSADGSDMKQLSASTNSRSLGDTQGGGSVIDWTGGSEGAVLMTRQFVPETDTGAAAADTRAGFGVEAVDTRNLSRRLVEKPRLDAVEYITDGHGIVRVMGTRPSSNVDYAAARRVYFYRAKGGRDWQPLNTVIDSADGTKGFEPYAVDSDLNVVYGFDDKDGRSALWRVALDGSGKRELVLANAVVDIDGLVRVGRQNRVVGASYATDRRHTEFFDPDLARLRTALGKALGGERALTFVDASADEKQLLIYTGSDVDPGRYYLFDKTSRKLAEVMPARPELADVKLATVKPMSFKAADGTMIPGYLTLPAGSDGRNLPAIVMPHGGPGARDEWGFDWLAQFYAARGFAVLQPNFRGSAGYGNAWFQKNGFRSWRTAIGDVNDAGRYLLSAGIAAPGKLAIVGWSYGGYAALQSAVLDPDLFKAIVAIAPVTDLETLRGESRNFSNYNFVDRFIGRGPEVKAGSPAQNAGRIKAPVLMFHGALDQNVGIGESRLMQGALKAAGKPVTLVEYPKLDHQLDDSDVRADMLAKSDAFLRASLGL